MSKTLISEAHFAFTTTVLVFAHHGSLFRVALSPLSDFLRELLLHFDGPWTWNGKKGLRIRRDPHMQRAAISAHASGQWNIKNISKTQTLFQKPQLASNMDAHSSP